MSENKKYALTKDILEIWNRHEAYARLRDRYVKLPLAHKKAVKCAIEAENARTDFWLEVKKLYPELSGKRLTAEPTEGWVYETI
jgi:hypothetical protein